MSNEVVLVELRDPSQPCEHKEAWHTDRQADNGFWRCAHHEPVDKGYGRFMDRETCPGGKAYLVPADRLNPWHTLTLDRGAWHMTHPITCDLANCEFDAKAATWNTHPTQPGIYRWSDPEGELEAT